MEHETLNPNEPRERGRSAREEARERGRRLAAEWAGGAEGLLEGLEQLRLAAEEAAQTAGELAEASTQAYQEQRQTPEGDRLAKNMQAGGQKVEGWVHEASDKTEEAKHTVQDRIQQSRRRMEDAMHRVEDRIDEAKDRTEDAWRRMEDKAHDAVDETKRRGRLVQLAGHEAQRTPAILKMKLKEAWHARMEGMSRQTIFYAVAGVLSVTAFILVTIGLVVGLTLALGAPWGAILTAAVYGLIAAGAVGAARAAKEHARAEAAESMEEARAQLRRVGRPLQEAVARK